MTVQRRQRLRGATPGQHASGGTGSVGDTIQAQHAISKSRLQEGVLSIDHVHDAHGQ